jgi:hypothetical protein
MNTRMRSAVLLRLRGLGIAVPIWARIARMRTWRITVSQIVVGVGVVVPPSSQPAVPATMPGAFPVASTYPASSGAVPAPVNPSLQYRRPSQSAQQGIPAQRMRTAWTGHSCTDLGAHS